MAYKVIKDTREKSGWTFEESERCAGMEVRGLKTGDYTLEGLEESFCIERKRSPEEIAVNLGSKWKQFKKELDRMRSYKHVYIICEFSIYDLLGYPENTGMYRRLKKKQRENPNEKIRLPVLTGKFLLKRLINITIEYPEIQIIYAGNWKVATEVASRIFNEISMNR